MGSTPEYITSRQPVKPRTVGRRSVRKDITATKKGWAIVVEGGVLLTKVARVERGSGSGKNGGGLVRERSRQLDDGECVNGGSSMGVAAQFDDG
ncbi:hypothetical protein V6N12_068058 [Hibiscus sabdariffa]|uniref:Uncharacterized protein n=1 Tax=Hibiscus sabdariffa TaxID=183260 RepID=A0ABR2FP54_9ROSI